MKNRKTLSFFLLLFLPAILYPEEKTEFTLSEVISISLKQNPLISAQRREVEARRSAYQASKRLSNPQLEFHRGKAKSHDGLVERSTEGFALSQYIENPFKRHHRIQTYEKDWKSAELKFDCWVLDITFEIKTLFHTILLLQKKEELSRKNLDSITKIHTLIERRAALGEVKELETIKLYVETLKAQNELNRIQTRLELARENLNTYLGNALPPDFALSGRLEYTSLHIQEQPLLDRALLTHPQIREKEALLARAKNHLSYLRWQRLPDFALTGFSHKELDGRNTGIGITLDIPLWNFRSNEIAEAESLFFKQADELKALRLNLEAKIKSELKHLRLSEQTLNTFHTGLLKQAEESLKISEVSYTQGEISLIDYLDSQRTYYSVLNDYQNSLYTWNVDKAALEKDVGEVL